MPKIIIREYDKTKANVGEYQNFSVVVPGFVSDTCDQNVFDENGIFECSSQKTFVEKIGKVPCGEGRVIAAVAPECESDPETYTDNVAIWNEAKKSGNLYKAKPWGASETPVNGFLKCAEDSGNAPTEGKKYFKGVFEPVKEDEELEEETLYVVILPNYRGSDSATLQHFGNQIAYELLGLGYSVLYKKLDQVSELGSTSFWEPLRDKATYDFRYVVTGMLKDAFDANNRIVELVNFVNTDADSKTYSELGRGDAIALIDIDPETYTDATSVSAVTAIRNKVNSMTCNSKYAAYFAPYVVYQMKHSDIVDFGENCTFPGYFHYLACAAKAFENYNEWYAIAGYNRGVSRYNVISTGCKLGEAAIDALEPRFKRNLNGINAAVNLIVKIKGEYFLWGNRTACELGEEDSDDGDLRASHFLNIRQLCTTIKKQVYVSCRRFTFDPNSEVLWINFKNSITPTLEKMKADQGISDYKFIKVATNQKAKLCAKIRIIPIEAVEDFDISLTLEDSLDGIVIGE